MAQARNLLPINLGRKEFVSLVALVMAANALAIDIIVPAMLIIGDFYGVLDANQHQWIIGAYLVSFGFGQLLFGSLTDVFGRRSVMLAGLAIYGAACAASAFAPSFMSLLIFRSLCGLGAAGCRVAITATVRDSFSGKEMAAIMSIVMTIFMAIPIFAPLIGQGILFFTQWQGIFLVMALFAAILFWWVWFRLDETLAPENKRTLTYRTSVDAFRIVLSTRRSVGYSLASALFFACLFGYVNAAPQIYLGIYELGPYFPLAFSLSGVSVALANLANARLLKRFGMRRISHSALALFISMAVLLAAYSLLVGGRISLPLFLGANLLLFANIGFIAANFNAIALEPLGKVAGTAASAFGFIQMVIPGVLGGLIGQTFNGTVTPILVGYVACGLASVGFVFWAERGVLFKERDISAE